MILCMQINGSPFIDNETLTLSIEHFGHFFLNLHFMKNLEYQNKTDISWRNALLDTTLTRNHRIGSALYL